mgnify:CR=1 FL=1
MNFNIRKYNIVICFTIVLICLAVVFSSVDFSSKLKDPTKIDADVINADSNNQDPENNNSNSDTNSLGMPKLTNINNNMAYLLNALDILEKYDYNLTISSTIEGKSGNFGGTQKLVSKIYKLKDESYIVTDADGSQIPLGYGETYTEYTKLTNSSVSIKRKGGSAKTQKLTDYLSVRGVRPDTLPFVLNSKTVKISPKNDPTKTYLELTLTLTTNAYKDYLKQLEANGGEGSNPSIDSITLTLKINKTYGYIISATSKENYSISRNGMRATTNATVVYSFNYFGDFSSEIDKIKTQFN